MFFIYSCANQLPPSGGEDDTIPPKIVSILPKHNTLNFKDNKIIIRFDEYIDRRSFQESFYISPKPKGEVDFNWSGKEVEVSFSNPLNKNKTYVITIDRFLRDIRGSNTIQSPITFAFSTGNKIDTGKISGKVYLDNFNNVKILAYLKKSPTDTLNPERQEPDYITHVLSDGTYELANLPDGEYRIFAITDEDRNNIFNKGVDSISVPSQDYEIKGSNIEVSNVDFILKNFEINKTSREFIKLLTPDSINYIYLNLTKNEKNLTPNYKFFFYFRNNNLTKADIVNNFSLIDSSNNRSYKLIFNWINDSLLEVFSFEKFVFSSELKIIINLANTKRNYIYTRKFYIANQNSFGKISGKIISESKIVASIFVNLNNKENNFISYSTQLKDDIFEFKFDEVLEGNYILGSFIDENDNGKFDRGNFFPFSPSEKFIIYEPDLKVKGSWNIENIFIEY